MEQEREGQSPREDQVQTLVRLDDPELLRLRGDLNSAVIALTDRMKEILDTIQAHNNAYDTNMLASLNETQSKFRAASRGALAKLQELEDPETSIALHSEPAGWTPQDANETIRPYDYGQDEERFYNSPVDDEQFGREIVNLLRAVGEAERKHKSHMDATIMKSSKHDERYSGQALVKRTEVPASFGRARGVEGYIRRSPRRPSGPNRYPR